MERGVAFCEQDCGCPSCLPSPAGWDAYAASAGFTGEKKDSRGRRICYANGKRVACPKKPGAAKNPPAGAAPAKAPAVKAPAGLDALHTEVQDFHARGGDGAALAGKLGTLSVPQLKDLHARLGKAVPSYKDALVQSLAVKAVVKARAARQPKAAPVPLSDAARPHAARLAAVIEQTLSPQGAGGPPDVAAALAPLAGLTDADVRAVATHVGARPGRGRAGALAAIRGKLLEAHDARQSIQV